MQDREAQREVADLLQEANKEGEKKKLFRSRDFLALPAAKKILKLSPQEKAQAIIETVSALLSLQEEVERKLTDLSATWEFKPSRPCNLRGYSGYPWAGLEICGRLLEDDIPFTDEQLASILETLGEIGRGRQREWHIPVVEPLISLLERRTTPLKAVSSKSIAAFREALEFTANAKERKLRDRLERMLDLNSHAGTIERYKEAPDEGRSNKSEKSEAKILRVRALLKQVEEEAGSLCWNADEVFKLKPSKVLLKGSPEEQMLVVVETIAKLQSLAAKIGPYSDKTGSRIWNLHHEKGYPIAWIRIMNQLLRRKLPFSEGDWKFMFEALGGIGHLGTLAFPFLENFVSAAERWVKTHGPKETMRNGLESAAAALRNDNRALTKRLANRLLELKKMKPMSARLPIHPGEAWSDVAIAEVNAMADKKKQQWSELLAHCATAKCATPTGRWDGKARELVKGIGLAEFRERMVKWFSLVDEPRTKRLDRHSEWVPDPNELIIEPHMDVLRGLAWCCGFEESKQMAKALSELARSCYRKVPMIGPRATRVGNAAVTALGMMPGLEGVYQLAYLKVKVKFGTAQKTIEKAFDTAAKKAGLPRDEIEELAVPSYGLMEVGLVEERLGEFTARLRVTGTTSTELEWVKGDGKVGKIQRGVPAVVKEKFGDELKELKAAAKDIERMLPAQRERIDTLFLQQKEWPVAVWRERYLDHPLVGVLARRLLWEFGKHGDEAMGLADRLSALHRAALLTGIWHEGKVVDLDLREIELAGDEVVRLWHPIGKEIEEVMAWREWLDAQQIQQPFKQAHREVYVLTEAERRTRTYSNRYAAHVLKQHQFNALCALRGWKNKLRMMVDDEYPPATLHLPKWGLRAEFWIEGAGTEYGQDTNESGAFLRVTTDQVRFYREGALQGTAHAGGGGYHPGFGGRDGEPQALEEIPPLVFSEVMRDVDVFVGVASVGNDPTWSDGGPNGQYRDYWGAVSFGELNGSAKTRKEVLERLVPRLKIGKLCTFEERFLVVKGKLRMYRIHLGSGNILMEPNDQYLCIVPKQGEVENGKVLLPFEGDRTLSVILSKAFLLAEDDKITDETITRQISGKS